MIFEHVSPALIVLLTLALGCGASLIARALGKSAGWALAVLPLVSSILWLLAAGDGDTVLRSSWAWADNLGVNWDTWLSPLGLLLAVLVSGIGLLITLYAAAYLKGSPGRDRFFAFLFLFMGAMLGIAITENLLVLFVFWEMTSITSYLLIGFHHSKIESRKSALDALLITGGGGLALLAGILLLGEVGGSYQIGELITAHEQIINHALYPAIFLCIFIGAITKSAQVPFHFWLPGAMAAPAPVSAYLHSATMVKAGVFLLALVHPILGGTPLWHFSLLGVGAITMTWGAVIAAMQTDLKRVLAFSTVSALGTMVMLLGIEHDLAAKAVIVFLIVHALYKAALFMVVGVLEKTTGIRDVTQLRGLFKAMPMLAIAAALAAASMSGLPPFIGFIAKELLYELKLEAPAIGWSLLVCGVIANAANIVVALNVGISPFLRRDQPDTPLVKPPTFMLAFGPAVLGLMSLLFGIFPSSLGGAVSAAATQIQAEPVAVKLKLWHGFNLVLLLSAVTVMLGLVGYTMRRRLWAMGVWLSDDVGLSGQAAFRRGFAASLLGFDRVTRLFQSGDLKRYHMTIALAVIAAIAGAWWSTGYVLRPLEWTAWRAEALIPVGLICASAVCLIFARTRMTAVLLLGCVGFGISALFAVYGAPDLAITQLLVETLTLVLFALAIYGLPKMETERNRGFERWATMGLAGALGLCFLLLTLKALDVQWQEPISTQIAERSVPDGYGRNIVNVILVDFRSLDTLGEIAVLLIAALGVASMLGGMRSESSPLVGTRRSPVLAASARYTAPAMIFISIYLLLRGHNDPGGGFIGGLVAAMSSVLVHLAHPNKVLTLLRMRPTTLASVGLALAGLSGLPGLLMKDSFLDAIWGPSFWLPLVGKVKIGTPLLFDIGVYAVVAGIVLLLYGQMEARHTDRQHRAARAAQGGV